VFKECTDMKEKKIKHNLDAWLDGELDQPSAQEVETLMKQDAEFKAEYEKILCLNALLDEQNIPIKADSFVYRLKYRLANLQSVHISQKPAKVWMIKLVMPAAVCVGLLAGILLGIEMHQVIFNEPAQQSNIARQYFGNDAMPVIPDDSITAGYIQLSSQAGR